MGVHHFDSSVVMRTFSLLSVSGAQLLRTSVAIRSVVLAYLLGGGLLFAVNVALLPAQTAEEVISNYYTTVGGAEAFQNIQSVHAEMATSSGPVSGTQTLKLSKKRGFFFRQEFMGSSVYVITNKEKFWIKKPDDFEPKEVSFKELTQSEIDLTEENKNQIIEQQFISSLPFFSLLDYEKDSTVLELKKRKKKVNKVKCFVIEVRPPVGPSAKYYFDKKNYLLLRIVSEIDDGSKGIIDISDYRKVDSLRIPHKYMQRVEGIDGQSSSAMISKISAIRFNPELPDDLFTVEEGEYEQ